MIRSFIVLLVLSHLFLYGLGISQDSLHLVATMVGPDTENPIMDAEGVGDMNGDGYDDIVVSFTNYCNDNKGTIKGQRFIFDFHLCFL